MTQATPSLSTFFGVDLIERAVALLAIGAAIGGPVGAIVLVGQGLVVDGGGGVRAAESECKEKGDGDEQWAHVSSPSDGHVVCAPVFTGGSHGNGSGADGEARRECANKFAPTAEALVGANLFAHSFKGAKKTAGPCDPAVLHRSIKRRR
jgi:hypothetical protein